MAYPYPGVGFLLFSLQFGCFLLLCVPLIVFIYRLSFADQSLTFMTRFGNKYVGGSRARAVCWRHDTNTRVHVKCLKSEEIYGNIEYRHLMRSIFMYNIETPFHLKCCVLSFSSCSDEL